jgi:hypothetical protein
MLHENMVLVHCNGEAHMPDRRPDNENVDPKKRMNKQEARRMNQEARRMSQQQQEG